MKHPKGLYCLFTTEMWERFSYYGMRAILVLYLTSSLVNGGLGYEPEKATVLYGIFTGLVYVTPLLGGWLADNYLGKRLAVNIGTITCMAGHLCLASGANAVCLYSGLTLLIIGNGFFKPNISVMVGELYSAQDDRKDAAYTIFYMGINLGAFFSPLVCGTLSDTCGYRYGFLAAAIGMLCGLIIFNTVGRKTLGHIGEKPVGAVNDKGSDSAESKSASLTKEEKDRTWVIVVLVVFSVFFFAGFEQAGSSMTLYADKYINRQIGNWTLPTSWLQSVNPVFILVLAPLFSMLWQKLASVGKEPSIPIKMGIGMIVLGLGFLVLDWACLNRGGNNPDETVKAGLMFMVGAYFLHTVGELCLSPIGLSMVSKLSPVKLASLMMGVWLLSSFVANIFGGFLARFTETLGALEIFLVIAGFSIVLGLVLLCLNKWLVRKSHGVL